MLVSIEGSKVSFQDGQISSVLQQCHMLGIQIWSTIKEEQQSCIIINQEQYAKLNILFDNKISGVEPISVLTLVGTRANELYELSCELLAPYSIEVGHFDIQDRSLMLFLSMESIDKAANLLHDSYITPSEMLEIHQKRVLLG